MTNNQSPTPNTNQKNASTEMSGNTKAALAYLVGWITGLIFLLTEKEDKFVRFHAAQSLVVFGGLMVISIIPFLGALVSILLAPVAFILWVVLMIKAYQGEKFMLPMIGEWAEQIEAKIK